MEIKIILFYNKSHKVKTNLVAIKKTLHLKKDIWILKRCDTSAIKNKSKVDCIYRDHFEKYFRNYFKKAKIFCKQNDPENYKPNENDTKKNKKKIKKKC